jgi:basic membrane protein A
LLALLAGSAVVAGLVPSGAASATVSAAKNTCPSNWKLTKACIPANQPDVNKDGKTVIAILSPGDTNDNGYYESFIITARQFAKKNKWKLVIRDKIPQSEAQTAARNACRQRPDMVAVAASELNDAIPVSKEAVCKGTVWYVAGGQGITQTPYFFQTSDVVEEGQYATGVAAGEIMKEKGITKAGFITGPELDF